MNIVTIYRFKTPFLDLNWEINKIRHIVDCIISYLKSEEIVFSTTKTEKDNYLIFFIKIDNLAELKFKIIKEFSKDKFFFPIFQLDVLGKTNDNKKIVIFLTNIFECFDGVNEEEYLIEISDSVYYKVWLFWKRIYPHYDFQNIDDVYKQFKKDDGVKVLQNFLKKYHHWFVLNLETKDEYHKVNSYLMFFMYLLYLMHNILFKVNENITLIDQTKKKTNWNLYLWALELQKKRLSILWNNLEELYPKYVKFLKEFLGLFSKN